MMREKDRGEKTVTRDLSFLNQVTICFFKDKRGVLTEENKRIMSNEMRAGKRQEILLQLLRFSSPRNVDLFDRNYYLAFLDFLKKIISKKKIWHHWRTS